MLAGVGATNIASKKVTMTNAEGETIVDTIASTNDFTGAPDTFATDGTEYEYTSSNSGVKYSATAINGKTGGIRGNRSGLSNFNFRNITTLNGYYISKISLQVSGGTMTIESGRTELYVKNAEMLMSASEPTGANKIAANEAGSGLSSITWENTEYTDASYLMLFSLKTSGTAVLENLSITWTKLPEINPEDPTISIDQEPTSIEKDGTITLTASITNAPDATVVWSSENEKIATVTQDGIVTGISSGIVKITASITVNDVIYSDFVNITVLFAEPEPIDIEVADILNTEANNKVIYRVTGRISILGRYDDSTDPTEYGNIHIADFVDSSKSILVYGSTVTTSALKFDNKTGEYVFNNPQDFLTNSTTNSLVVGDVIEMLVFRLDFNTTKELNGVITKVYSDVDVLDKFVDRVMHTEVSYEETGTGLCITEGWYDLAKQAYALLTDTQRATFASDEKYAQPYARLRAWASANGDTFDENNQIVSASNALNLVNNNNNIIIITVVTSALLLLAALVFIVMRKRKTN